MEVMEEKVKKEKEDVWGETEERSEEEKFWKDEKRDPE